MPLTNLVTSSSIDADFDALDFQESVIDKQNSTPSSPSEGDRYLVDSSPSGDFSGHADEIAEYNGSNWEFHSPDAGFVVYIENQDRYEHYSGSAWGDLEGTLDHDLLSNIGSSDHHTRPTAGAGIQDNSDTFDVGDGNALTTSSTDIGVASDGIQTDELDLSITPTWTGQHQFSAGVDVRGDIVDDTTQIWDSTNGHLEQSALENDSVTVAGNSVSLGSSTTVDYVDLSDTGSSFPIPNSDLANSSVTLSAGAGIDSAGSVSLGGSVTLAVGFGNDEDLDFGGSDQYNLRYDSTAGQFELESADIDGGGTTGNIFTIGDGGQVLDFNTTPTVTGTNVVLETRSLTGGNAIDSIGDLSSDRTIAVTSGGIQTDELDLSITPTWTGSHTWNTSTGANLSIDETGLNYNTSNTETLNIQNSGTGSVTLQEDGTEVTKNSRFPLPNSDLSNSSVTVAGNSVSLGSSTTVDYVDLNDTGSSFPIPNSDLSNSSVTLTAGAGIDSAGSVSLGGSVTIAVGFGNDEDLDFGGSDQYNLRYDSTNTRFELESADIDGGGTTGDVIRISDGAALVTLPNGGLNLSGGNLQRNGTAVVGTQESAISSLTNSQGATTTDGTLESIPDTSANDASQEIERNITELNSQVDSILTALRNHGLIAT